MILILKDDNIIIIMAELYSNERNMHLYIIEQTTVYSPQDVVEVLVWLSRSLKVSDSNYY